MPTPLTLPVLSSSPSQLHNEDDSSEASTSEQQPCTSATAQAGTSTQAQAGTSTQDAAAGEASGSGTQAEADAPPPPYASIDLGATAAPGMQRDSHSGIIFHLIVSTAALFSKVWFSASLK